MDLVEEAETIMETNIVNLPASQERLEEFQKAQAADPVCSAVMNYCRQGWPDKDRLKTAITPFWKYRGQLTVSSMTFFCVIVAS